MKKRTIALNRLEMRKDRISNLSVTVQRTIAGGKTAGSCECTIQPEGCGSTICSAVDVCWLTEGRTACLESLCVAC